MSVVILDSFENENSIGITLKRLFDKRGKETSYFRLKDMEVNRCTGCGACGDRTPGRCILKDDMETVFKAIAKGDYLFLLTPLRFGGYSSRLKLSVDRFMVLGLPTYFVKKGTLLHNTRYGNKKLIGIAMIEENLKGQEENFNRIVEQNANNLSYSHATLVFRTTDNIAVIEEKIRKVLEGESFNE